MKTGERKPGSEEGEGRSLEALEGGVGSGEKQEEPSTTYHRGPREGKGEGGEGGCSTYYYMVRPALFIRTERGL